MQDFSDVYLTPEQAAEKLQLTVDTVYRWLRSRKLRYGAGEGRDMELRFPDARYLGLWSKPGAPFVCIEPWRGVADPQGFDADLREKPGIELLAAGASLSTAMFLSLAKPENPEETT